MIELIEPILIVLGVSLLSVAGWCIFLIGMIGIENPRNLRDPDVRMAHIIVWIFAFGTLGFLVYGIISGYVVSLSQILLTLIIAISPIVALLIIMLGDKP